MESQVHIGKIEPRFPTLQMDSLPVEPQGKPKNLEQVAYPFFRGSPDAGIKPGPPALQMDSLPAELQGEPSLKETIKNMERHVHNGKINLKYLLK